MPDPADCFFGDLPCFPGTPPDPMKTTTPFWMPPSSSNCTFRDGMHMIGNNTDVPAESKYECCALCWANVSCMASVYTAGVCHLHRQVGDTEPQASASVCYTRGKPHYPSARLPHIAREMHNGRSDGKK